MVLFVVRPSSAFFERVDSLFSSPRLACADTPQEHRFSARSLIGFPMLAIACLAFADSAFSPYADGHSKLSHKDSLFFLFLQTLRIVYFTFYFSKFCTRLFLCFSALFRTFAAYLRKGIRK